LLRYFLIYIMITFFCHASPGAKKIKYGQLLKDAEVSYALNDLYRAYRRYSVIKNRKPRLLRGNGLTHYLETIALISTKRRFQETCAQMAKNSRTWRPSEVRYNCARISLQRGRLKTAASYLAKVPKYARIDHKVRILSATVQMGLGDGQKCLSYLPSKLESEYKKQNLNDLFRMTRARCFVLIGQMEKSIIEYQHVSEKSKHYISALYESAWANFKMRRLETANTLLEIMIAGHEGYTAQAGSYNIGSKLYYEARYLGSYVKILGESTDAAQLSFAAMEHEFAQFAKVKEREVDRIKRLAKNQDPSGWQWTRIENMPPEWRRYIDTVRVWADDKWVQQLTTGVQHMAAIDMELERLRDNEDRRFSGYRKSLEMLKGQVSDLLRLSILASSKNILQKVEMIRLKTNMGKVESIWVKRTEGMRSIDEVLDAYRKEAKLIGDYIGG
jgi:hypothetical protein